VRGAFARCQQRFSIFFSLADPDDPVVARMPLDLGARHNSTGRIHHLRIRDRCDLRDHAASDANALTLVPREFDRVRLFAACALVSF